MTARVVLPGACRWEAFWPEAQLKWSSSTARSLALLLLGLAELGPDPAPQQDWVDDLLRHLRRSLTQGQAGTAADTHSGPALKPCTWAELDVLLRAAAGLELEPLPSGRFMANAVEELGRAWGLAGRPSASALVPPVASMHVPQ